MHGRHQNKEKSLSADPDTQSDRREMEAEDLVAYSAGGQSIFGVKKGNPGYLGKSVIFEFERTGGCEAFIQEVIKEKKPSVIRYRLSEEGVEVRALIDAAHRFANRYAKKHIHTKK